jgi:large subunit ribosomal protein L18
MALVKQERRYRIKKRIRKIVSGTASSPRLSVFRSNKAIYAQLIDDATGTTIAAASSLDKSIADATGTKSEKAAMVGKAIAEKAKAINIEEVKFDRGGYLYHGRVKSVADAAREGGLKF